MTRTQSERVRELFAKAQEHGSEGRFDLAWAYAEAADAANENDYSDGEPTRKLPIITVR